MGASGKLLEWDRTSDLSQIEVPTLVIGAQYDTMDPEHMEWMASVLPHGQYLYCPAGSHMVMYDDQEVFFDGLIRVLLEVDGSEGERPILEAH